MVDCCFPLAEFIWAELALSFAALLAKFAERVERVLDRMREAEGQHFPFSLHNNCPFESQDGTVPQALALQNTTLHLAAEEVVDRRC